MELSQLKKRRNFNPLSVNPTKCQTHLRTNCLSMFDHFVGLALKELSDCNKSNLKSFISEKNKNNQHWNKHWKVI